MVARTPLLERLAGFTRGSSLERRLLIAVAFAMSLGGLVWGLFLVAFDLVAASAIPFGYAIATALNLAVLRATDRYVRFRTIQLALSLGLPFGLQLALGGFVQSSGVLAWALVAPFGAMLFTTRAEAWRWFAAFGGILVLGAALEPWVRADNGLPATARIVLLAMNVTVPTTLAFLLLDYFVAQKDAALALLAAEQAVTERLLLNVLPEPIAKRLRTSDGRTIAERFDSVSVLFADVVGFTRLSEELDPEEMIGWLNEIFTAFDQLAEKYGVEKIRTIGDGYMAACGAPERRDDHAHALVRMALEMHDYLERGEFRGGARLRFRIGINSGAAVAGVIGKSKFHYDLWGDAVNLASRMESHGEPGRIQIGEGTWELVRSDFALEPREVEIKGKGKVRSWFVLGPTES